MTTLRQSTAIIFWIIIVSFVGLIVVEWGMDYTQTSATKRSDAVGVINGETIPLKRFQEMVRNAARQEDRRQDRGDDARLIREVWDSTVRDVLVRQQIENMGIQVTDKEVAYFTRTQPPEVVQAQTAFQTNGTFDPAKYAQFLSDPATHADPNNQGFILWVEQVIRNQLLEYKLQRMLMETVRMTPAQVRQYYLDQNEKVRVEYVFAPADAVSDAAVSVDDAEAQAYYQEHADEFRHPDQVRIAYVFIPRVATAADSARVGQEVQRLRQELVDGEDFAGLAKAVSEDPNSAANGGDLGTFGRGRMVKAFETAAFALVPGELSPPVQTPYGWHLIKVEERVQEQGEEKVHARHILLRYKASPDTEEQLRTQGEDFRRRAEGQGLEAAAQALGLEVRDSGWVNKGSAVPGLGTGSASLVNSMYDAEPNTISQLGGNEQGFWVAQVKEKRAAGLAPLDQARTAVEQAVRLRKKTEAAAQQLEPLRPQVAHLAAAAARLGLQVQTPEPFARADYVPSVGRANAFVGAAFRLPVGGSEVVQVPPRGAYLIHVLDRPPVDETKFQSQSNQVAQQYLRQAQSEALQAWFAQIYKAAKIEDSRHLFYTF
jgi:peptidyl-prolyl cis-trans isomerase D